MILAGRADKTLPQRVAVFGAGRSGRAVMRLCNFLGIHGELFDENAECFDCQAHFGRRKLADFDVFVFSPGFAADHQWRKLCCESGRPCFGETGFAASFWKGRIVGVTGTNGKSSVTALLADALCRSGAEAVTAGNIGTPLSEVCLEKEGGEGLWAVCEISSFQAELSAGLHLDGLVWTNFAEDHLDRHGSMEAYLEAKANLLDCMVEGAPVVLGPSVPLKQNLPVEVETLSPMDLPPGSPFSGGVQAVNLQLALQLWCKLDLPEEALRSAAAEFIPLPHRLQKVAEFEGVVFWNDSKATNFHAAQAAVQSMKNPVFWIGGGRVKGGDLSGFAANLSSRISAAYLYGEASAPMAEHFSNRLDRVFVFAGLEDALKAAADDARAVAPAAVLFSPGFCSFDQFTGFEERGECFISAVLSLKQARQNY